MSRRFWRWLLHMELSWRKDLGIGSTATSFLARRKPRSSYLRMMLWPMTSAVPWEANSLKRDKHRPPEIWFSRISFVAKSTQCKYRNPKEYCVYSWCMIWEAHLLFIRWSADERSIGNWDRCTSASTGGYKRWFHKVWISAIWVLLLKLYHVLVGYSLCNFNLGYQHIVPTPFFIIL